MAAVLHEIGVDPEGDPAVVLAEVDVWLKRNQPTEDRAESDLYRQVVGARRLLREDSSAEIVPVSLSALTNLVEAASRVPVEHDTLSVKEARREARTEIQREYRRTTVFPLGAVTAVATFLWVNENRLRELFPEGWAEAWFDLLYLQSLGVLAVIWLVGWIRQRHLQQWVDLIYDPALQEGAFGVWFDAGERSLSPEEYGWTLDEDAAFRMMDSTAYGMAGEVRRVTRRSGARQTLLSSLLDRKTPSADEDLSTRYRRSHSALLLQAARAGLDRLEAEGVVRRVWDRGMRLYQIVDPRPPPTDE